MSLSPFVTGKRVINDAFNRGFAVGAFNTVNLEITQAISEACAQLKTPCWISTSEKTLSYAGVDQLAAMSTLLAHIHRVPTVLHLDHGYSVAQAIACINAGYSSVMIDASLKSYGVNVAWTKKVVAAAKRKGVSVEAELGVLARNQDTYTDPRQARDFVAQTNVDYLAVAVGTRHGAFKLSSKETIDLERLREIHEMVSIPLVLHGASSVSQKTIKLANKHGANLQGLRGIPERTLQKAILAGVAKINIDTDLRIAFTTGLRVFLRENPTSFQTREALLFAKEFVKNEIRHKIELFGAKHKARRV